MRSVVVKIIIIGIVIVVGAIGAKFYIFKSQKTISPISSDTYKNKTIVASEKQPSGTLKEYIDNSGFSFKYPEDVVFVMKETEDLDPLAYADIDLASYQAEGGIHIRIADTRLKSLDDFFKEKLGLTPKDQKEIKIGEVTGGQTIVDNNLLAAAVDQDILFTIEVASQNQKYWLKVYDTILSSFNFVPKTTSDTVTQPLDDSNTDAVLEEEIVE